MEEKSGTILLETLTQMGLNPKKLTSNGLIEVEHQGKQFFFHHAKTALNSQLAAHLTGNKFLTRIILQNHSFQNIPFLLPKSHEELVTFFETNSPVIMKPITGHYGNGVQKLDNLPTAPYEGQLFEKYIDGVEYRYLILDGNCLGVQRRDHAPTAEKPWEKRRVTISTDKWSKSCQLNAMGVLDDITISQTSIVEQLTIANPKYSFKELYMRAMEVGRDHIASLVNTLVLVYAGASLPLFLLFSNTKLPYSYVINQEIVTTEIVRTLVSSVGIVAAVPLTTLLAAFYLRRKM